MACEPKSNNQCGKEQRIEQTQCPYAHLPSYLDKDGFVCIFRFEQTVSRAHKAEKAERTKHDTKSTREDKYQMKHGEFSYEYHKHDSSNENAQHQR